MSNYENGKRIAKNTLLLYLRMSFTVLIALYTSRVILKVLGVEDYGIYNIVGSIVSMFAFINFAMASATQRFLTYELGKKDFVKLSKVFNTSLSVNLLICLLLLILGESVGYWFVQNKLNIPAERFEAAMWVYQFSIFSCMLSIIISTYSAIVIAHERMACYAYISVIESVLKLLIVLILTALEWDKLKSYSFLFFTTQLVVLTIYAVYCMRHFVETKLNFTFDKSLLKDMFAFSAWNLMGTAAYVISIQGVNILLNIFMGPMVNAARGIAVQVQNAVQNFGGSFQQALNPQITKSYASGDFNYMHSLIVSSSKYTFYLLLLISLPVVLETEVILTWWLKVVPDHTVNFVRIMLIKTIIACVSSPIMISAFATGKIRVFQIVDSVILFFQLPISFFLLKFDFSPESVFFANLILEIIMFIARIIVVFPQIKMPLSLFMHKAILPIFKVGSLSIVISLMIIFLFKNSTYSCFFVMLFSVISTPISVYMGGLTVEERQKLKVLFSKYFHF